MKITDVRPLITRGEKRNLLIVKIETDRGYYGWGESGLVGRELAVKGAVEHYRQFLVGRDPRRIGALWQEIYRSQYFEGGRVLTAAISAIDIALHDLVARSLGVPVYQLLGGAHRELIPCFTTSHAPMGPEAVDDVRRLGARDGRPSGSPSASRKPAAMRRYSSPGSPSPSPPNGWSRYVRRWGPRRCWVWNITTG